MKKSAIKKAIDEQHVKQLIALFPKGGTFLSLFNTLVIIIIKKLISPVSRSRILSILP